MTIAVNFVTVADSISKLSIAGVNVFDIDQIPAKAMGNLPALFPAPDGFISDISFSRVTKGSNGTAKMDFSYTLKYRFLHSPVGSGGGLVSTYADLIAKLALILVTIFTNDSIPGALDMQLQNVSDISPMLDPAGSAEYHGVDIMLRVEEIAQ